MNEITGTGNGVVAANRLLHQLAIAVLQLGVQLDISEQREPQAGPRSQPRWVHLVRQLFLVDALDGDRSVVVTGEQGAGKTLLMRNLYPEARDWLEDNAGRGEKNPVRIVENFDLMEPRGKVTFRLAGPDAMAQGRLTETREFGPSDRREWQQLVRGEDPRVLLCTLEVPPVVWGIGGTGFVLLPGLERGIEQHWQHLVKIVLATSRAAVLVADERRMANAAQLELLRHMRPGGSDDLRFVVAISRCEASTSEVIAERVARAVTVFNVDKADVVPIGRDLSAPEGWGERLLERVDGIRASAAESRRLETEMLRAIIETDLMGVLDAAHYARRDYALNNAAVEIADQFLEGFDKECEEIRTELERKLSKYFGKHMMEARERLRRSLNESHREELWKRTTEYIRLDQGNRYRRLAAMVEEAWWGPDRRDPNEPGGPHHAQLASIRDVADARWSVVSQRFVGSLSAHDGRLDKSVALALTGCPPVAVRGSNAKDTEAAALMLRQGSVDEVIKALPVMALYARAFAIELARPDGRIPRVTEHDTKSFFDRLVGDHQQLLVALGLLLGGDLLVDGDLDTPANLVKLTQAIFTGSTAGAGAAGAAAIGSAMLAAIGVVGIGAALVKAGNDAMSERENIADRHLQEYRTAAEQGIRENIDELLHLTREVLQARLHTALGVSRGLNAQFSLLAATQNVEDIRARMLTSIGHAELD